MNKLQFSILSYYPSLLSGECINIGIAYMDKNSRNTFFSEIKKWSRVEHFDDEIDIDFLKYTVSGIKLRLDNNNMLSNEIDDLSEVTRHFVNELQFSNLSEVEYDDLNSTIDCINKIHMRFDYEKHERPNQDTEKKYLRMIYKQKKVDFNSMPIVGSYDEKLTFDFVLDNKECVKIIRINDSNAATYIHHAKSWAYTCNEMKASYKFIFLIIDEYLTDKKYLHQVKRILGSCDSDIYDYDYYINKLPDYSLFSHMKS